LGPLAAGGMSSQARPRRVLVTGHRGYLGSVLQRHLLAAGWQATGLDSSLFARCGFAPAGRSPAIPSRNVDIRDVKPSDLQGYEAVVHLAGLSNDPLGNLDPDLTDEINRAAAIRLARAAKDAGVERFLFASSCSNYGAAGEELLDEDAPLRPVTAYGKSKVEAEAGLAALSNATFAVTSLRLATAYGLSPMLRFDLVINNLVAWATAERRILLKSDGSPWRPLVHVEDIAEAFLAAIEAPVSQVAGKVWNVLPAGENYRVAALAELVAAAVPGAVVVRAKGAGADNRNYRVCSARIARELPNWRPTWTARSGIAQLVACLSAARPLPADFEGPRYQRLAHLQQQQARGRIDANLRLRRSLPLRQEQVGVATA
jgi:nucleoside-diphosphate-sugar epimerase